MNNLKIVRKLLWTAIVIISIGTDAAIVSIWQKLGSCIWCFSVAQCIALSCLALIVGAVIASMPVCALFELPKEER